jgi:hypothetical protein
MAQGSDLSERLLASIAGHVWGHSLNSIELLDAALARGADALETDVAFNTLLQLPVMKHASTSSGASDLLTKDWLAHLAMHVAVDRQVKVLKLDFKSLEAVLPVVDLLEETMLPAGVEIWLNADILPGPGTSQPPIVADAFLDACSHVPHATLSLGWTTGWSPWVRIVYEDKHVDAMLAVLESRRAHASRTHVTFPVRASLARSSWPALARLLDEVPNSSITLWTGEEGVPEQDLDVQTWVDVSHRERFHLDCDKGPKHARYHPMRLAHYAGLAWQHGRLW